MTCLNIRDVTALPLTEISSRDLGVRRIQEARIGLIGEKKIKIAGSKESLDLRVACPLVDKLQK
jgi:hypothetical protein